MPGDETGLGRVTGARALLLGTGTHAPGGLPDVPAVATTLADLRTALIERCGLEPDAITVLTDPATLQEMGDAVAEACAQPGGLLLVHYVGHGVLSPEGALHLAAASTAAGGERVGHTGLRYADVARLVRSSQTTHRVVVLDCCFGARALDGLSGLGEPDEGLADRTQVPGGFVLTSASRYESAVALPGARRTAFTGALLNLLADGIPGGPADLTLQDVARHLSATLPQAGYPRPRSRADNQVGELVVAPNPAYRPPPATTPAPRPVPQVVPTDGRVCPWKGLASYDVGDARWFHGRSQLVTELLDAVRLRHLEGGRPLVVLGVSGAGKSSVLRAGLLSGIARGELEVPGSARWPLLVLTPAGSPVADLAARVASVVGLGTAEVAQRLRDDPEKLPAILRARPTPSGQAPPPVLIVADQVEDLGGAAADRQASAFFRALTAAAEQGAALVVLAMRTEFYGRLADRPEAAGLLADSPVVVRGMTGSEIREVIEQPARQAGLTVAPELVDLLIDDLGSTQQEAGRLPLLSHALRATWWEHRGDELTVTDYRRTGGLRHALAAAAERKFQELAPTERELARWLFLRLVRVDDGADLTRRVLPLADLMAGLPPEAVQVLDAFTADDARLLTADDGYVQITHAALVDAWPTLRSWIDRDRANLVIEQDLSEAARRWDAAGREPGDLGTGNALRLARWWAWLPEHRERLTPLAAAFLEASVRRAQRRTRLRVGAICGLVTLLVLSSASGAVAFWQWRTALEQRELAVSRSVMLTAESKRLSAPETAVGLGVAAARLQPGGQTLSSLAQTLLQTSYRGIVDGDGYVRSVAFSPDRRRLIRGDSKAGAFLWDITDTSRPRRLASLPGHRGDVPAVAFAPSGTLIATADTPSGTVILWNVADPRHPVRQGTFPAHTGGVNHLTFTSDGRTLATAGEDRRAILWDVTDPTKPVRRAVLGDGSTPVMSIAVTADGRTLATAGGSAAVALWDITDADRPRLRAKLAQQNGAWSVAFSPDGRTLASGGTTGSIVIWDVKRIDQPKQRRILPGHQRSVVVVAYTANGQGLTSVGMDGTVIRWYLRASNALDSRGFLAQDERPVLAGGVSGDGALVAYGAVTRLVLLSTDFTPAGYRYEAVLQPHDSGAMTAHRSPDGRRLAALTGTRDVVTWDLRDVSKPVRSSSVPHGDNPISAVAYAPGGRVLTTARADGSLHLLNAEDPGHTLGVTKAHTGSVEAIAYARDGRTLVTAGADTRVVTWDVADQARPVRRTVAMTSGAVTQVDAGADASTLAVVEGGKAALWHRDDANTWRREAVATSTTDVTTARLSPDGRLLALGSSRGTLELWNVTTEDDPTLVGFQTPHPFVVTDLDFSPDGLTLVTASVDGTATVWDVSTPTQAQRRTTISSQLGPLSDVDVLPDATGVITASAYGSVIVWDTADMLAIITDPLREACELLGPGLTEEDWRTHIPDLPYRRTCP